MRSAFQARHGSVKCVNCRHGETQLGKATVTLERNGTKVLFMGVLASVYANYGEEYGDAETTARLLEAAEVAAGAGVQVTSVSSCLHRDLPELHELEAALRTGGKE